MNRPNDISCGVGFCAHWNFGPAKGWSMIETEGTRWERTGELCETGRAAILKSFGLEREAAELPLNVLQNMSPAELYERSQSHGAVPEAYVIAAMSNAAGAQIYH